MDGVEWLAGVFDVAGAVSIVKQRDVRLRPSVQVTVSPGMAGKVTDVLEAIGIGEVSVKQRAGRSLIRVQSIQQVHALAMAMVTASRFKRDHWQAMMQFARLRLAATSQRTPYTAVEWGSYYRLRELNGLPIS